MHMTVLGDSWDADIYDCQRTPETLTRQSSQLVRAHVRHCHGITCVVGLSTADDASMMRDSHRHGKAINSLRKRVYLWYALCYDYVT